MVVRLTLSKCVAVISFLVELLEFFLKIVLITVVM